MTNLEELEKRIKAETDKYQGIPVALSGGVDSSLLAALVKPEFVFSVRLPSDHHNEIQYSSLVAKHLGLRHEVIEIDDTKFDEYFQHAVRAIGRPIPHFNIFPLYCMYKKLSEMGIKKVILGDGPDETMCGYARNLIMAYLYQIENFEAFQGYLPLMMCALNLPEYAYAEMIKKSVVDVRESFAKQESTADMLKAMNQADIDLMRPDMDDMSNAIAKHFGIENIRPYQDNPELDNWMFNLPPEDKIHNVEFGKYLLRQLAAKYLPEEIAWRKIKVGGPVYPVNILKGWLERGLFDKTKYLEEQVKILADKTAYN